MRTIGWGIALGVLGLRTLYGAKADSRDVLLGGRYAVPAAAQPLVNALATYSPPRRKR
jgi:hypothetical protein